MIRGKESKILGDMVGTMLGIAGVIGGAVRELGVSEKFGQICPSRSQNQTSAPDDSLGVLREALAEERKARELLQEKIADLEQKLSEKTSNQ